MTVWVVFKKIRVGSYEDVDVNVKVILITQHEYEVDRLIEAADLLDVRDEIIVCCQELK